MKKVGIIGGLGPVSTLDYYSDIINGVRSKIKEDIYPEVVIDSINMTKFINSMEKEDYNDAANQLICSIENLRAAKAEFVAIASNTPHIIMDKVKQKASLPILSIVEANAQFAKKNGYKKIMVIGTKFTMKSGLYTKTLNECGIDAFVPDKNDIENLHELIFPNLENGIIIPEHKKRMIEISEKYISKYKADVLLLGCTEIPLMIKEGDVSVPIINTTKVHIDAIVDRII